MTIAGSDEKQMLVCISTSFSQKYLFVLAAYIKKLSGLGCIGMVECNKKAVDMSLSDCPDEFNAKLESQYRDLISSSIFLYQWTRPDLGYTVTFLSRCLDKPGVKNLKLM